ncbi:MAG: hypothetical protein ACJ71J_11510 [Nitrososphaeraceae archaeon]|jgi:hypothetical protein
MIMKNRYDNSDSHFEDETVRLTARIAEELEAKLRSYKRKENHNTKEAVGIT